MNHSALKRLSTLSLIVIMAIGLSSCGRRGALEAPNPAVIQNEDGTSEEQPVAKPDRPFILDGII